MYKRKVDNHTIKVLQGILLALGSYQEVLQNPLAILHFYHDNHLMKQL